jgi:CRP-like cAMP-binding protein
MYRDETACKQLTQVEAPGRFALRCRDCGIRHMVLFADLRDEDLALIHMPIEERRFAPGEPLYRAGEDGSAVFTVRSGLVKLVQYLPDGTQRIVRLLRRGSVAGMEVLVGEPYAHSAIPLQPTETCRIPRAVVDRLSTETPRLHGQLMRRWRQSVQQADDWLTELSTGNARQRLARLLLQMSADEPTCHLPTREDIGAMLGITMETASRTVAEFRRLGLIAEVGGHEVRVGRGALEAVAEGE